MRYVDSHIIILLCVLFFTFFLISPPLFLSLVVFGRLADPELTNMPWLDTLTTASAFVSFPIDFTKKITSHVLGHTDPVPLWTEFY